MRRGDGPRAVTAQPWLAAADEVVAALGAEVTAGLSTGEAVARLERHGPNVLDAAPPVPVWRRLLAQFRDPLVYILLAAVTISLAVWAVDGAVGVPFEAIVIAVILAANAVIGFVQEAKAEQAVAALQRLAASSSTVRRDGREQRIPAAELVVGDVLLLAEGDAVNADGRLLEAASLSVAEAALTGESQPVVKDLAALSGTVPVGDRVNMVFSGTAVARGRGTAVVTATGMATEMGRIARMLEAAKEEPTPLQREIAHVGRVIGLAVIGIAVVVMAAILLTADIDDASDLVDVLLVGVSLAVAAVPEGLPAVLSVVLALGVQRMAKRQAIVKDLSSVETLGSASVICSDKTGTLTRNEMTVQRIVTRSGEVEVTGTGYAPDGALLTTEGRPVDGDPLLAEIRAVLSGGALASDASVHSEDGRWVAIGDPTEAALVVAERKAGFASESDARFDRVGEVPFTSERKLMSTLQVDHRADDEVVVMTKGAPDVLLARCTHERLGSVPVALDDVRRRAILDTVDRLAADALRTLGVAYRGGLRPVDEPGEEVEHGLVFAGVVGIVDPPREEAKVAIAEAQGAGLRVLMITGDHPVTAARIARELGIAGDGERAVSGVEIDELDDEAFGRTVRDVAVYARVAPEHKVRIVDSLQADAHIVCMTGDGVNDAPALKSADIGVAMGVTGTDVAKEAARMILADDNFATIVTAVREGRGIFSNIRKFLRYLLSSNAGEVLTMLLGVLAAGALGLHDAAGAVAVPLLATQILWINLLTDTAPALAMGVDPPLDDVMTRRPRKPGDRVIDAPMIVHIAFNGTVMAVVTLLALDVGLPGGLVHGDRSLVEARTMAFTTLVLAQLFNCLNARSEHVSALRRPFTNRVLWGAIALSLVLQVAVVHAAPLQRAFGTAPMALGQWLLCSGLASCVLWSDELRKLALRAGASAEG
ncbi:MAG: cation-translocating P-type ATPase [Actinobacteria bacterium]|nr:cation-translocating P-type ATPase [Actinomycetota bacterium]